MTKPLNEPSPDAIVEGIHQIRKNLLDQYGGDLRAYFDAARKRQNESGNPVASHLAASSKTLRRTAGDSIDTL